MSLKNSIVGPEITQETINQEQEQQVFSPVSSITENSSNTTTNILEPAENEVNSENVSNERTKNSNYHILVLKSYLSKLKQEAELGRQLIKRLQGARNTSSEFSKRLFGAAMAMSPQTSFSNAEILFAAGQASVFADIGIDIDPEIFPSMTVSDTALQNYIQYAAADALYEAMEEIKREGAKVYLMCDKGAKKTTHTHFVKILAWYSKSQQKIKTFNLDCDYSESSSEGCSKGVLHSIQNFFGEGEYENCLFGQITDSGGGGTGRSFHKELRARELCCPPNIYQTAHCTFFN
jgi:hypothetical protein